MTTPYVGEIRLFAFPRIPSGWTACDGSLLPIAQYEVLYALLGTTYGGDGISTFAVPDLRGQLPLHMGTGPGLSPRVLGQAGGSENVSLATANLPPHTHAWAATSAAANANVPSAAVELGTVSGDTMYTTDVAGLQNFALNAGSISNTGGSQPHENTMPTLTASFCIAWDGIYPSQG
ncbi:MAG: phage tail protein [Xanthomonadaceae bacterium]|jgi:microcystin-dependent protein|nr:phage tail protein [Xanthomonadaceae bacterium]MDE3073010.1 phage tail protein [Pseudomonadota bacterium]